MTTTFYSLPTPAGEAELAGALATQDTVPFTHIAIGDGNGAFVVPDGRTTLVHQVDKVKITSIRVHPAHANWIVLEAAVPEDQGGYTIRELAVIGGRTPDTILAVGNYPEFEKPAKDSGAAAAMILRMVIAFEHGTAAISMVIDPQAYATLQTVMDQIAAHEGKADPHPQYRTQATTAVQGIVELATDDEAAAGIDTVRAVVPAGVAAAIAAHRASSNPHPEYKVPATTATPGIMRLATSQEAAAGADDTRAMTPKTTAEVMGATMGGHTGAADPHSQYLTSERLAANAANNWAEQHFHAAGM